MAHTRQFTITCDRCGYVSPVTEFAKPAVTAWRGAGGKYNPSTGDAVCMSCRPRTNLVIKVSNPTPGEVVWCQDAKGRLVGVGQDMVDGARAATSGTDHVTLRLNDSRKLLIARKEMDRIDAWVEAVK
jgi:hypothetical protein